MSESYPISWWRLTDAADHEFIYENISTGEKRASVDLPPGACYATEGDMPTGSDGLAIVCVTPALRNGKVGTFHWWIDYTASNCTKRDDDVHRCWVRHGTVGDKLHVDKNGNTCAAGAGSIQAPGWHGYLHHGVLHT